MIEGGSSPHTRGARKSLTGPYMRSRIIPAYAGSTACSATTRPCPADHPRIRGEHPPPSPSTKHATGSSPHTRGARRLCLRGLAGSRIIPAYAGSTRYRKRRRGRFRDHPRIRGEHANPPELHWRYPGSSPHTRGALDRYGVACPIVRIIPAYAGSTRR